MRRLGFHGNKLGVLSSPLALQREEEEEDERWTVSVLLLGHIRNEHQSSVFVLGARQAG